MDRQRRSILSNEELDKVAYNICMTVETFQDIPVVVKPYIDHTQRGEYSLDRMQKLLSFLGDPQEKYRVVHIAGTSGKTSTAYYVAALLKAAGFRTGLTISPHTFEVNERVQIDCQPLLEPLFCADFELFMEQIEQSKLWPTYFEIMIAFAFWEFARQGVEYAVVEVGIGGLLDSTNVVKAANKVCVITDIGLDHTDLLGDTYQAIATQKAGIIQPENRAFMYRQSDEIMHAVQKRVDEMRATLTVLEAENVRTEAQLPLFQQRNFGLALAVVASIAADHNVSLSDSAVRLGSRTFIPGRMETFHVDGKTIILDGAHNGQKMQTLLDSIEHLYKNKTIAMMLGFVKGPMVDERISEALPLCGAVAKQIAVIDFAGAADYPRQSASTDMVAHIADTLKLKQPIDYYSDVQQAWHDLLAQKETQVLVVTGSIYLLSHVRPLLDELRRKK